MLAESQLASTRNFTLVNMVGILEAQLCAYVWIVGGHKPQMLNQSKYRVTLDASVLLQYESAVPRGHIVLEHFKNNDKINFQDFRKILAFFCGLDIGIDSSVLSAAKKRIVSAQKTRHIVVHTHSKAQAYEITELRNIYEPRINEFLSPAALADNRIHITDAFIKQLGEDIKLAFGEITRKSITYAHNHD